MNEKGEKGRDLDEVEYFIGDEDYVARLRVARLSLSLSLSCPGCSEPVEKVVTTAENDSLKTPRH